MSAFNLAEYFLYDRLTEGLGDKVALRFGDRSWTYEAVAHKTDAVRAGLAEAGVEREQRVYIVLPDTPPFAWAFFGTLAHGAVVAMGNPAAPPSLLSGVIEYARPAALITTPEVAASLESVLRRTPSVRAIWLVPDVATGDDPELTVPRGLFGLPVRGLADVAGRPAPHRPCETTRDDAAIWLFTSGSTGRPKAAVHAHRDFEFNTERYALGTVGYRRDDVTVSVPRLFFGYATGTNLMFPFRVGATVGLFSERATPEALAEAIARYRPTVVTNVPTTMSKLLAFDDARREAGEPPLDLSCCRFHLSAGEALPPALLARFTERFGVDVYDGIGSAEMFHIYASNRPGDIKAGSLGRVVDGYEIRILPDDADGPGTPPLPPGETGVLWVKGDSVAMGYFQDRDTSWRTFFGHWCRTGDLFRLDDQGYLWFSGRADSLIKVSGQWVAPLEVESCLMDHPAVAQAAVVGAEEAGLVRVKAFVVLRGEVPDDQRAALEETLREHVAAALAHHKAPRWFEWCDDLPRNDRGKIDRKALAG